MNKFMLLGMFAMGVTLQSVYCQAAVAENIHVIGKGSPLTKRLSLTPIHGRAVAAQKRHRLIQALRSKKS